MKLPHIYFSGNWGKKGDENWVHLESGMTHRCTSYAYCGPKSEMFDPRWPQALKDCRKNKVGLFLDSGAFSFFKTMQKHAGDSEYLTKFLKGYRQFIRSHPDHWDFYVNFDYVKNAQVVWDMQKRLEKMGLKPAPVFHGDSGFDWLRRYCEEGYDRIMIGRVENLGSEPLRRFYSEVFEILAKYPHTKPHGLMVTGQNAWRFPWYSVDSASWLKVAAFGGILLIDQNRKKIQTLSVTGRELGELEKVWMGYYSKYTYQQLQGHYLYRGAHNAIETLKIQRDDNWIEGQPRWQNIL